MFCSCFRTLAVILVSDLFPLPITVFVLSPTTRRVLNNPRDTAKISSSTTGSSSHFTDKFLLTQTHEQVTAWRVVFFQARFSECPTIGLYASFTSIFIGHFTEFCQSRCVSSSKQSRPGNLVLLMCACTHTRGETECRGLYRK